MLLIANRNYVAWDTRSPLIAPIAPIWVPIPTSALNFVPKFTWEGLKTPSEHLQYVADVCLVQGVTDQNVTLRLHVASFKGRVLDWYRTLGEYYRYLGSA